SVLLSLLAVQSEFSKEEWQEPIARGTLHVLELSRPARPAEKSAPLYFAKKKGAKGSPAAKAERPPTPARLGNPVAAGPETGTGTERRVFQLPPLPGAKAGEQTLMQPDVPAKSK